MQRAFVLPKERHMFGDRVLVLAPHTDDAELGAGGTISRLCQAGKVVQVCAFSRCEESLPAGMPDNTLEEETIRALQLLGVPLGGIRVRGFRVRRMSEARQEILDELISMRKEFDPDTVLIPSCGDIHQDHQIVHAEGIRAFKHVSVLGYELPWNSMSFDATAYVKLRDEDISAKIRALQEYRSQVLKARPYFDEEFLRGWARLRGMQVNSRYAEAFEVLRLSF